MTEAAEAPAPALGYSILANLGDEKQLTVQCFVDSEEELPAIHRHVDKAMAVVDRQKAKYKKRDLEAEVIKMEKTLRQLEEDLLRLDDNFNDNVAAIDLRAAELGGQKEKLMEQAAVRGRVKPVGQEGAQFNAINRELEKLKEDKAKAAAERDQARSNAAVSIGRYRDEIAKAKEQIEECEALIAEGG